MLESGFSHVFPWKAFTTNDRALHPSNKHTNINAFIEFLTGIPIDVRQSLTSGVMKEVLGANLLICPTEVALRLLFLDGVSDRSVLSLLSFWHLGGVFVVCPTRLHRLP